MLIKFKHLVLENFLSFGYAELDLNDRGYTSVSGINKCSSDNALSNGSGKSSIFSAVCYALCGETVQGLKSNLVNIYSTGGMKVELTFDVNNDSYKIIRSKDHKELGTSIRFYVNGEDKSGKGVRDTEKIISSFLPDLTSDLIGSVIILGQGMPQKFTNNTPSGRKEVLEKLSKSDFMIEDIKNRLTNRKIALNRDLKDVDTKLTAAQSKLEIFEKQLPQFEKQLKELVIPDISEIDSITARVNSLNVELSDLHSQAAVLRDQLEEYNQQNSEITNKQVLETTQVTRHYQDEIGELKERKSNLNAELNTLNEEIKRLKSIVDVCPTCGQKLPDVHKVDTTDREIRAGELSSQLTEVNSSIRAAEEKQATEVRKIEESYKQEKLGIINRINSKRIEISNLNKQIDLHNDEIRHQAVTLATLQTSLANYEVRKKALEDNIKDTHQNIEQLRTEILYNNTEKTAVESRLDAITKMITLATRDFRGFLLTNVIEYLNKRIKVYSLDIFGTDKLQLLLDGNNLNVSYNSKPYESLSGGEQKRVDLIAQLSLRDMLMQFSNFSSNILVLDEIFENLDAKSSDAVVDALNKELVDIESIFIVTHRSNLALPTDSIITIVKDEGGVSSIVQ